MAFQQQVTDITIHMSKNDGLENYLKKKSHPGDSVSLAEVWELGSISGRLLDNLGGFTCIQHKAEHLEDAQMRFKH